MATGKRSRRARKPRPEDRLDDLFFKIDSVKRRWSRGPRLDINTRKADGIESSDHLEFTGVTSQSNELGIDRVQLTMYGRSRDDGEYEYLGFCERVRGDRELLTVCVWLPLAEVMALAPSLLERQFVELELRIRGFFRSKGRVQSIGFHTQIAAYEDWLVEVQGQGWPGDPVGRSGLMP